MNFDAIVNGSKVTLLEIAFRTSGNGLCEVGAARDGFDFESATALLEVENSKLMVDSGKESTRQSVAENWRFTSSLLLRSSKTMWVSKSRFVPKQSDRYKIESLRLKPGLSRPWESVGDEVGYVVLSHNEPIGMIEREIFGDSGRLLGSQ